MALQLDRLTDQERDLLRLLAQGHTAKTIANAKGLSVNVVNERLRSARRKTGAVSSRELARLIGGSEQSPSQENWDKFFGIENTPKHGVECKSSAIGADWKLIGRSTMIFGVLVAVGLAAYLSTAPNSPEGGASVPSAVSSIAVPSSSKNVEPREYTIYFEQGQDGLSQSLPILKQAFDYGGTDADYRAVGHWVLDEDETIAGRRANSIGIALRTYGVPGDHIALEASEQGSQVIRNAERQGVVIVTPRAQ